MEFITKLPWHRIQLYPETRFSPEEFSFFNQAISRLQAFEPIQYIIGEAWFDGMSLKVGPGTLIPRPETEELLDWAAQHPYPGQSAKIMDLCTGSGCIALGFKRRIPNAAVMALEFSQDALAYARENGKALGLDITWIQADLLQSAEQDFKDLDIITCNPPYIPQSEAATMEKHVLAFEPGTALFVPDMDPLLYYNKVSAMGCHWLRKGGGLFFEVHEDFADEVASRLKADGYEAVEIRLDLQGKPRMVRGIR